MTALTVCDTEKVMLPTPEQATNLGYGIWLIKSASDAFYLREYSLSDENIPQRREHPGCHVCIITLECGTQLISKNIKIRPDLETCDQIQAQRIQVQLPRPLQHLLSGLPYISDLPYFDSKTDANIILMKKLKFKTELSTIPLHSDPQQLMKIAEPIAHKMQLLKPALTEKLNTHVPFKLSLMLNLFVFIGNLLLHTRVLYLYHRFRIIRKLTPRFPKFGQEKHPVKPVVSTTIDKNTLQSNAHVWRNKFVVLSETQIDEWCDRSECPKTQKSRKLNITFRQSKAETKNIQRRRFSAASGCN